MSCQLASDSILYANGIYRLVYEIVGVVLPCWVAYAIAGLVFAFILVNAVLLGAAVITWGERRVLGRFQNRVGPNRWGPFGLFQPVADLVKLLTKEDLRPEGSDRVVFSLVPVLMVAPLILMTAVVPFAKNTALASLNVGVLFILAVSSITSVAIFMAGWSSNNRYAMFGAARAVAVLISYEIPVVLSLLGVVMVAASMSLGTIVAAQALPFFLVQPLAFFVFMAGMSAELNRSPFDVAEAESEIIAGYHTEYSGVRFALIQAAEFGGVGVVAAIAATLFLGGWSGPWSEYLGWLWFLIKTGIIVFLFIWFRATYPRLRIDQIMAFSWKFLLPLAMVNLVVVTLEVFLLRGDEGVLTHTDLAIMAAINLAVTAISIAVFGNLIKDRVTFRTRQPQQVVVPGVSTIEVS
ncbi:MAG: NADH-quinone oxidoreductase subunit NuoH [Chloroflexota bacterium]|nr:NADH-quinone oxidoreductase subunit NuoH [Chloroflexota bacterium]